MFNYPGEYFQLPWGVFSITLGSIFNYAGEYFQLPWGVFSTTLGSIVKYPGEYFLWVGDLIEARHPADCLLVLRLVCHHPAPIPIHTTC